MPAIKPVLLRARGRVRGPLRALSTWRAFPGLFLITVEVLDWISRFQTAHSLSGGAAMDLINLLRDWGWLFGIIWLGFLVVRESSRPGAAERERALANVRMAALDAIRKFEKLSMAYEVNLPRANRDLVEIARMDVMYSFGNLIRAAIAVDPERRWEYEALLYRIKLDHGQTYDLPRSTFASTTSPLTAIDVALKKYPPPEPSKES